MFWIILAQTYVDWMVRGEGLIRLLKNDQPTYVREVRLLVDPGEALRADTGAKLDPPVLVPRETISIKLRPDGVILATLPSGDREIGCLALTVFDSRHGVPRVGPPGKAGMGIVVERGVPTGLQPMSTPAAVSKAGPNASRTLRIEGRPLAECRGERVLLEEIAELSGPPDHVAKLAELSVGAAPLPGASRLLTRSEIMVKLRAADVAKPGVEILLPDSIRVTRACQEISPDAVTDAARQALRQVNPRDADELYPELAAQRTVAPVGSYHLIPGAPRRGGLGWIVPVTVSVDGKVIATLTVRFQPLASATATAEQVKVGTQVNVQIRSGTMTVTTTGVLRSSGRPGDTVTVVLTTTKKLVRGKLLDAENVEVIS